ncbi:MAG: inosine/xanthosine triphosphatase [bacterium]
MRVCLGGTFDPLHAGHQALLRAAFSGADEVFVGVTDGKLAKRADRVVPPWEERAKALEAFVRAAGYRAALTVRPLVDAHGPAAREAYDRIVVSPETAENAIAINVARKKNGLKALEVIVVPHVLAQDLLPVSGTAIHSGRIDAHGTRLVPMRVAVGSGNVVKVDAVRQEFQRIVDLPYEVRGFAVKSGVPEQPKGEQAMRGAARRAAEARKEWPECDYAVGVEAGLIKMPGTEGYVEAQACVIVDRDGWETHGWGPAFHYPDWVTSRALTGEMVSDVLGPVANDKSIGSTTGAIGYLSEGRLDRIGLSRMAILMAFVPRFRRSLYVIGDPREAES